MRVIHKGYAVTTYGVNHLTVSNPEGKVIYQTDRRDKLGILETENGLRELIEVLIRDAKRNSKE